MTKPGPRGAATSLLAVAISAIAVLAIALATGPGEVEQVFRDLHPGWIGLCVAASLVVYPAYMLGYLALISATGQRPATLWAARRTVLAGFGPFSIGGGFRVDLQALRALDKDEHVARGTGALLGSARVSGARAVGLRRVDRALGPGWGWHVLAAVALSDSGPRRFRARPVGH